MFRWLIYIFLIFYVFFQHFIDGFNSSDFITCCLSVQHINWRGLSHFCDPIAILNESVAFEFRTDWNSQLILSDKAVERRFRSLLRSWEHCHSHSPERQSHGVRLFKSDENIPLAFLLNRHYLEIIRTLADAIYESNHFEVGQGSIGTVFGLPFNRQS